jgi:hypothetical protein
MNVRPTQSSPFHPTCSFRNRLKKALRLIRDRKVLYSPCARWHSTSTETPQKGVSVTTPEGVVVAAWIYRYEYLVQKDRVQNSCPDHSANQH